MKTKSFVVTAFLLFPAFVFGQSLYDDLYSNPKVDTASVRKVKSQKQEINNTSATHTDQQYRIESTKVGDQDVVVVRNMDGDTVYYSGDNAKMPDTATTSPNQGTGEYANRIDRFHNNNGTLVLDNGTTEEEYPLDNVNWSVNVIGGYGGFGWGYPYGRCRGYWGGGLYSPWYSGLYDPYWDWDYGWDYYGWGYPYYGWGYYGWGYPGYRGGYRGGFYGHPYDAGNRRLALTSSQSNLVSSGSRVSSGAVNGRVSSSNGSAASSNSRSNASSSIGARGSNTAFWNNFLSSRGYNVNNSSSSIRSNSSSRVNYSNGSNRSSSVVRVSSSSSSLNRSSSSSYSNSRSGSSYSSGRSSGGSYSGGGSRGGGGGRR